MVVQHLPGVHHVALGLAHLLAGLVQDVAQRHHVAVGGGLGRRAGGVEQRGLRVQRIEPAAGLVHALTDEVGREVRAEGLRVLKRVMPLGVGHGAAVEPGVGHFRDPAHLAPARGAVEHDLVDEGAVRIRQVQRFPLPRAVAQLVERAHRFGAATHLATPDRQRRAPVALATDRPVHVVGQPVAVAAVAQVFRVPVDQLAVRSTERVQHLGRGDVPGRLGVVEQRRLAAPAERIRVMNRGVVRQQAPPLQVLKNPGVRVLDKEPEERGAGPGHAALQVHRLEEGQPLPAPQDVVVRAEGRRDVHDPRPLLHRDEVGLHHATPGCGLARTGPPHQAPLLEPGERQAPVAGLVQPFIGDAHQVATGQRLLHRRLTLQGGGHQRLRQDQPLALRPRHHRVLGVRVYREGAVAGQRPGGGGPGEEGGGAGVVAQ